MVSQAKLGSSVDQDQWQQLTIYWSDLAVVDFAPNIKLSDLTPNLRVALRSDSCTSPASPFSTRTHLSQSLTLAHPTIQTNSTRSFPPSKTRSSPS